MDVPDYSHDEFDNSNGGRTGDFQSFHADDGSIKSASAEPSSVRLGLILH